MPEPSTELPTEAEATLSFIQGAAAEYRGAPYRSADWLAMQVMDALDGSLAARPAPDLGDDGELVRTMRS